MMKKCVYLVMICAIAYGKNQIQKQFHLQWLGRPLFMIIISALRSVCVCVCVVGYFAQVILVKSRNDSRDDGDTADKTYN